jgi:hypothetical protein
MKSTLTPTQRIQAILVEDGHDTVVLTESKVQAGCYNLNLELPAILLEHVALTQEMANGFAQQYTDCIARLDRARVTTLGASYNRTNVSVNLQVLWVQ